jgi:hypothetical protein
VWLEGELEGVCSGHASNYSLDCARRSGEQRLQLGNRRPGALGLTHLCANRKAFGPFTIRKLDRCRSIRPQRPNDGGKPICCLPCWQSIRWHLIHRLPSAVDRRPDAPIAGDAPGLEANRLGGRPTHMSIVVPNIVPAVPVPVVVNPTRSGVSRRPPEGAPPVPTDNPPDNQADRPGEQQARAGTENRADVISVRTGRTKGNHQNRRCGQ